VTSGAPAAAGDSGSSSSSSNSMSGGPNKVFFHNLSNMRPSLAPVKELKGPVGQIQESKGFLYAVEQNRVLVPGNSNR